MTTHCHNIVLRWCYEPSPDHGTPVSLSSGRSHGSVSSCFSLIKVTVECTGLALTSTTDKSLSSFTILFIHVYICLWTVNLIYPCFLCQVSYGDHRGICSDQPWTEKRIYILIYRGFNSELCVILVRKHAQVPKPSILLPHAWKEGFVFSVPITTLIWSCTGLKVFLLFLNV